MKTVLIVAASISMGLALLVVGAVGHAQRFSNAAPSNEPSDQPERVAGVPAKLPEPEQWQFITNPGVSAAVTRFFRMVQDDTIKADGIFATPVLLDDKLLAEMDKVGAFVDEAREKAPRDEKSHTIVGMKMLPPVTKPNPCCRCSTRSPSSPSSNSAIGNGWHRITCPRLAK